jgi:hypothetical protein
MKGQEVMGTTVKQNMSHMECHSVEGCPFSCSEITFQEMFAAKISVVQHSSRISSAGYSKFPPQNTAL